MHDPALLRHSFEQGMARKWHCPSPWCHALETPVGAGGSSFYSILAVPGWGLPEHGGVGGGAIPPPPPVCPRGPWRDGRVGTANRKPDRAHSGFSFAPWVLWRAVVDLGMSLSGFVVGILVGLTGVGGGAIMTPLLILLFGVQPTHAVGTDLAYATVTKIFGSVSYIRREQVNWPYVRWLVVGSVPTSLFGVMVLLPWLVAQGIDVENLVARVLGVMLLIVGVVSILEHWLFAGQLRDSRLIRNRHVQKRFKEPILVVGGALIGLGVGLTSVGSGSMLMAILLLVSELPILVLIGTDIVHATILLGAAGLAHWSQGHTEWPIVFALLLGSIPGVWVGSRLSQFVPATPLRILLALILAGTGIKLSLG